MNGLSFSALREATSARLKEWGGAVMGLAYRGNEFAGEAGEACNEIKKLERERLGLPGSRTTVEKLASELADTVICADIIAEAEGIDLGAAIVQKFNAKSEEIGLKTRLAESSARGNVAAVTRHDYYAASGAVQHTALGKVPTELIHKEEALRPRDIYGVQTC